jgi:hypothetical protein
MFTLRSALVSTIALALVACGAAAVTGGSGSGVATGPDPGSGGSGGSGGSAFYLPFVASTTGSGATGVFVIPSNDLSATPIFVTKTAAGTQAVDVVGFSKTRTVNSSNVVTSTSPYALLYLAVGSDGNAHLYAVNLSDVSVAPSATQVSSLSLSSLSDICSIVGSAQTNLYDPTTQFVVLRTNAAGSSSCGNGGDVYQVAHYSDSSTTDPTVVDINTPTAALGGMFTALYQTSGALGGLVLLDATGDLDFYTSDAFTSPTVLTSGVTFALDLVDDSSVNSTGYLGASTAFLSVTTSSGSSVWRVPSSGEASSIFSASGILGVTGVADTQNVYFTDTVALSGTERIYQEAISGGTPMEIYSAPVAPGSIYFLVGSNGTSLVLTSTTVSITGTVPTSGSTSTSVLTLPVGNAATPTVIAGPFSGQVSAAMCPATFGNVASDDLLLNVTETQTATTGATTTYSYSSEVLAPSGGVTQATLADSAFLGLPACTGNFGTVLQVRGITDTNGGYGGGTVSAFDLGTSSVTALSTTSGSGNYTISTGDVPEGSFLSDDIGLGIVGPYSPPGGTSTGLAFDIAKTLIVPVTVPDSNISVLL